MNVAGVLKVGADLPIAVEMAPDSVSSVGGATAAADTTATTTPAAEQSTPASGAAFGEALKVAKGTASTPSLGAGSSSAEALARAKELGLAGDAGAYDVLGHHYAHVEGGSHSGSYVNTSGNARNGQTFEIVKRGGNTYHVYGDHTVRVGKAATPAPAEDTAASTTAGGTAAVDRAATVDTTAGSTGSAAA